MSGLKSKWQRREDVLLCHPMDDKKLNALLYHGVYVQPKLNGIRCRAIWDEGTNSYHLVSSENNPIVSMPHIQLSLNDTRAAAQANGVHCPDELDGECYKHGWPLEKIYGLCARKKVTPDCYSIEFWAFDTMDAIQQALRLEQLTALESIWKELPFGMGLPLVRVDSRFCTNLAEVWDAYAIFMARGVEGIIVRGAYNQYVRKRTKEVLKFKPKKKDWYQIREVIEAVDQYGTPLARVGAFACCNAGEKPFRVGMGVGVPHELAALWWDDRFSLVGKFAEIEYQELTAANGVPRFGKAIKISDQSYEERIVLLAVEVSECTHTNQN